MTFEPAWLGRYGAGDAWEQGRHDLRFWQDTDGSVLFEYKYESRGNHGYALSGATGVVLQVTATEIAVEVRSESDSAWEDLFKNDYRTESTTPRRSELRITSMRDGKPVLTFGLVPMTYLGPTKE